MDLKLDRRVAVVTGASKGIGLAVTRTLLAEGARVVAVSRSRTAELDELAGPGLLHVAADLMDPQAPARVVAEAVREFGGVDVLVNNAGGVPPGVRMPRPSFLDASDEDWQAVFEFNLFSAVRAVRAVLPVMLEAGGGSIVNVSSGNARQPSPMNADYGAAKAGMHNLTKVLSEEFAPKGVRVNTVSPGPVRTAWWTDEGGAADTIAAMAGSDRDTVMDTLAPQMMNLSTGRLADPQEVADAVALLASPRSASTTGAEFAVDSGFLKGL
ncbi:SDR family NAD(P)-dependent oxidoreductase [Allokutzneria sp. NRRL B-24872]|uniref:SDR family NAD(P)-dependent oxidoreductase n=1 Tax=Allokutzneria sp. NRRL B-24872 TaxID=1137961 RepID=UPI000A395A56|nr:SDR family oxidoreductase [Allokutzneria sp. NRRL B-24872]